MLGLVCALVVLSLLLRVRAAASALMAAAELDDDSFPFDLCLQVRSPRRTCCATDTHLSTACRVNARVCRARQTAQRCVGYCPLRAVALAMGTRLCRALWAGGQNRTRLCVLIKLFFFSCIAAVFVWICRGARPNALSTVGKMA